MNIQRITDTLALNLETIKNVYPKLGEQIVSIRRCIDTTTCTELNVTTTRGVLLICQYLIEDYSIVLQQLHPSIRNYYINRFQCIYKNMQDESLNQKQSTVSMAYRDIVFVICMLHDYLPALQISNLKHKDWLINIIQDAADNLSNQIKYDYGLAMERCQKKNRDLKEQDDIGGDALSQLILKSRREHQTKERKKNGNK